MNPVEVILLMVALVGSVSFAMYKFISWDTNIKTLGERNKKRLSLYCRCGCNNKIYPALGDIYDKSTNSWWTKDHYQKLLEGDIL